MKLGSRKIIFLSLSIALSACVMGSSAVGQFCPKKDDLKKEFDMRYLKNWIKLATAVVSNFGKMFDGLKPYFFLDLTYSQPDSCHFENPLEVIRNNGFEVKEVNITSQNGYILTAWRVKCRKNCGDKKKYPVLIQHGLLCSGADWLYLGEKHALPYLLADDGYEVWIGNARGTKYSQGHKNLDAQNPDSPYWHYSVDEMGYYDVPSTIDKMKDVTKMSKINYVGYSMGTTMFFIYASDRRSHYTKNVNRFVGLAPAMYIHNLGNQFKLLGPILSSDAFHNFLRMVGIVAEMKIDGPLRYDDASKSTFHAFNTYAPILLPFVKKFINWEAFSLVLTGDPFIKNIQAYQRAMGFFPENISLQTIGHYIQFFAQKSFPRYKDHSKVNDNETDIRPYDVGNVKVPSLLIGGLHDALVVPADFRYTAQQIKKCPSGNCARAEFNMVPCFTHLDFIWGPQNGTKVLVYEQILDWFDETWDLENWPDLEPTNANSEYCRQKYLTGPRDMTIKTTEFPIPFFNV